MKILIVNTSDISGGAAKAGFRLHQSLLQSGVNSKMIVLNKISDDSNTLKVPQTIFFKYITIILNRLENFQIRKYPNRIKTFFSISKYSSKQTLKFINKQNADIVHLHWINSGMLSIQDIAKINKPIIWSLHDNWPFTGGCHVKWDCKRFEKECGNCPILNSNKLTDLSFNILNSKHNHFSKIKNLKIIGLSKWMVEISKSSSLLKSRDHFLIPNPINTSLFQPILKNNCRARLNLAISKKTILFGAVNPTGDTNKGFKLLSQAIKCLESKNIELIIFGADKPQRPAFQNYEVNYFGFIKNETSLANLYNSADVMVVPSQQENLSNTIMESLSCGTPVVAFNIGGNSDMIEHKVNGYLARPLDSADLAKGIEWILNNKNHDELCTQARKKVMDTFDSKLVVKKYIKLYQETLEGMAS